MSDPCSVTPKPSDEELLSAALTGDDRSWRELVHRLNPYLSKVIWRRAGDLPEDQQEEVKQEVWASVARRGPRPDKHSVELARDYIRCFVRTAIDRVRAAYRAPGTRSRLRHEAPDYVAPELVSIDTVTEHEDDASTAQMVQLYARLEFEALLAYATPVVQQAAVLMLTGGYNVTEAAVATGLKRLALHRALRALGRSRAA
jgi:DNA-directed RNA polymerase specialized sigma24 family protein